MARLSFLLDNDFLKRVLAPKPSYTAGRTEFTYQAKLTGTPNGDAPNILAKSYTMEADVEVPPGGGEGMIVTDGGRALFAQWQAGLHLQSPRARKISMGRAGASPRAALATPRPRKK
jgi:hypothetical protein